MAFRKSLSARERERLFVLNGGICHLCAQPIQSRIERYEIDHVIQFALTQDDSDANRKPAHVDCHKRKTHGVERDEIACAERLYLRHNGHLPRAEGNNRIPSRPFPKRRGCA